MWLYNNIIVDTFYHAPVDLAQAVIAPRTRSRPSIRSGRKAVPSRISIQQRGVFRGDPGFYIAGIVVWVLMGLLCVYTMFLIALSHLRWRFCSPWGRSSLRCCCSRARSGCSMPGSRSLPTTRLITLLTIMAAALLLQIVDSYAKQTADRGAAILTVDALNMVLVAMLVFLFMRQVMPIASGLAGGAAFNTYGTVSRAINWSARVGRGAMERGTRTTAALLNRDRD